MQFKVNYILIVKLVLLNNLLIAMPKSKILICPQDTIEALSASGRFSNSYLSQTYFERVPRDIIRIIKTFAGITYFARLPEKVKDLIRIYLTKTPNRFNLRHTSDVRSVSISENGSRGLLCSNVATSVLSITNSPFHEHKRFFLEQHITPHTSQLKPCLSSNGKYALTCRNRTILYWNFTEAPFQPLELNGHLYEISAFTITPNGAFVISCDHLGIAYVWDLKYPKSPKRFDLPPCAEGPITSACISDDGIIAIICSNSISIINLEDLTNIPDAQRINLPAGPVSSVVISSSGDYALTASKENNNHPPTIIFWKITDKQLSRNKPITGIKGRNEPNSMFSADGSRAIINVGRGGKLVDFENNTYQSIMGAGGTISALCVSSDGKHVFICSDNKIAILWEYHNSSSLYQQITLKNSISTAAMSECGNWGITGGLADTDNSPTMIFWHFSPSFEEITGVMEYEYKVSIDSSSSIHSPLLAIESESAASEFCPSAAIPAPILELNNRYPQNLIFADSAYRSSAAAAAPEKPNNANNQNLIHEDVAPTSAYPSTAIAAYSPILEPSNIYHQDFIPAAQEYYSSAATAADPHLVESDNTRSRTNTSRESLNYVSLAAAAVSPSNHEPADHNPDDQD